MRQRCRGWLLSGCIVALVLGPRLSAFAAEQDKELSLELIDPKVFRVCADQRLMPFSNEQGQGFENKLAELLAGKLGKTVGYTWFPQGPGFVRNTLGAHKCDVIMGYPQGSDLVQSTNPYYRTAYALVFKSGHGLDGIEGLGDDRLKSKRIGIIAGTPPSSYLAKSGLMANAKPYPLAIDTRYHSSVEEMMKDLDSGEIDVGILSGPMAGYQAKQATPPLSVVPLIKEQGGPPLVFRMTMAVRFSDQEWKRSLNRLIEENQPEINRILLSFGVPLLDEQNRPIDDASISKRP
jgi:quinoprotein dehydrogenase-associated probable ABC transporter substrate-binding protein